MGGIGTITQRGLELGRYTHSVKQDRWMVYEVLSSTQFAVATSDPIGAVPWVTPTLAADYVDCEIEFITGPLSGIQPAGTAVGAAQTVQGASGYAVIQFGAPSITGRVSSMVKSVVSEILGGIPTTIVTLYDPLPGDPNANDQFIIYRRQSPSSITIGSDLREDGYTVETLDLTIASNAVRLGVTGRSCTVLALGGAAWQISFVQGNGVLGSLISSSLLFVGSLFNLDFNDIAITNAAAAGGTASPILYVGQRV